MMEDLRTPRILRGMAWQRAKGELQSLLETFYDDYDAFCKMNVEVERFVKEVEDNGLQE